MYLNIMLVIAILIVILVNLCAKELIYLFKLIQIARRLPTLSGALPIVGHGLELFKYKNDVYGYIQTKTKELQEIGGTVVVWLGPLPIFVVSDPDDALIVANECLEKGYIYKFIKSWLGEGLLTGNKSIWKLHRKLINPSFNQSILIKFMPIFNENSKQITNILHDKVGKGYFDPIDLLAQNNLDILCKTVLGVKPGIISVPEYRRMAENIIRLVFKRVTNVLLHLEPIYKLTLTNMHEKKIASQLKSVSLTLLNERNNENEQGHKDFQSDDKEGSKYKPFFDLLIDIKDNGFLDEQEVREELDTMVLVGYNTTTFAQMFILPMLAAHHDVQDKVYDEIKRVIREPNKILDRNDLSRLVYMDAVIKEVMRIYPLVPVIIRNADQNVKLRDVTIPFGTIVINVYGMNNNQCWGDDAGQFKPERWLQLDTLPKNPNAFASFSIGKRNCIGKPFAMLSIKTFLAYMLREYKINKEAEDIKVEFTLFSKPVSGHEISLELRSDSIN